MRLFSAIFILFLTTVTTFSQNVDDEPIRPFAYTVYRNDEDVYFDNPAIIVLDLHTGNILHSIESSCSGTLSPDGHYITYQDQFGTMTLMLDLISGDIIEFLPNSLGARWSLDSTQVANLTYDIRSDFEKILTVYDVPSFEYEEILRGLDSWSFRWIGDNLYISIIQENLLQLFFWDRIQVQLLSEVSLPDTLFPHIIMPPDTHTMIISSLIEEGSVEREFLIVNMISGEVALLQDAPHNQQIIWHPDGTGFAMTVENYELVFFDITTNTQEVLVSSENIINNVKWSEDGRYISYNQVYIQNDGNGSHRSIHIYDSVTELTHEIRNHVDRYSSHLNWISNTQFIYNYARADTPHTMEAGNLNDLYLYNVTTDEHIQLTSTSDLDEYLWCLVG